MMRRYGRIYTYKYKNVYRQALNLRRDISEKLSSHTLDNIFESVFYIMYLINWRLYVYVYLGTLLGCLRFVIALGDRTSGWGGIEEVDKEGQSIMLK